MTAQSFGADDMAQLTEFAQWFLFGAHDEPGYRLPGSTAPNDWDTNGEEAA